MYKDIQYVLNYNRYPFGHGGFDDALIVNNTHYVFSRRAPYHPYNVLDCLLYLILNKKVPSRHI